MGGRWWARQRCGASRRAAVELALTLGGMRRSQLTDQGVERGQPAHLLRPTPLQQRVLDLLGVDPTHPP
ncbi:hypothetical protein [Pseudofrankia sp. DC12]|uniref:hypothetical protein n=1 Tax=Pseudofrankia sp. DC12 TaxID=683315 RepID=UPI0005F79ACC|nr:hypothetical protein [Pseudofrankia sp. DC12]